MAKAKRPDWLNELIEIVEPLCGAGFDGSAGRTRDKRIGAVFRDAERPVGWFWLGIGGRNLDADLLDGGYLAPENGDQDHRYQLIEAVQEGSVLRVRVAEHAPSEGLFLWMPGHPPGFLEKSLLDGLLTIDRFDLAGRFATGTPDPVPPPREGWKERGLNREQGSAWTACMAPGAHLVWGPPGTGKTTVIAAALRDLIPAGKTALLVSGTNIAVDNALERAVRTISPEPGIMVRVGTPQLREIADNPAICLRTLIRRQQAALEEERLRVQTLIAESNSDPVFAELANFKAELEAFDADAYQAAAARIAGAQLLARQRSELEYLRQRETAKEQALSRLMDKAKLLTDAWRATEPARTRFGQVQALRSLKRLKEERDRRASELKTARERRRFGHGHLKTLLKDAEDRLFSKASGLGEADLVIDSLDYLIQEHLRLAAPYTEASVKRVVDDFNATQTATEQAARDLDQVQDDRRRLASRIEAASQQPSVTAEDYELVAQANEKDLPGKLEIVPRLEERAAEVLHRIGGLEKDHERVLDRMQADAARVSRDIITGASVVAATLATLRLRPAIRERDYDYVIVDEVAFACVPEVVYAASRATTGVTLLGDFLQNGPIPPDLYQEPRSRDPRVRRWYQQDCFALFGIKDPASALKNAGCVTLVQQHRFGAAINELANAVAYDGILQVAPDDGGRVHGQEVIVVDVDGLGGELAAVKRNPGGGRWWPVGALLARALAEHDGVGAAGVVTPYKLQAELIQNVLAGADSDPRIDVGTSHRFQGREFDTVVFDLVEDGIGPPQGWSWAARGSLTGTSWEADGVRLFNVGITRARKRLYLIASGTAVKKAGRGPLRALSRVTDKGLVHTIRAADVLGLREAPADDPVASEIWHALHDHATLIDLFDEDNFPDELCRRIDAASKRIWLWSPWVGRRSEQMLPHLRSAQDRGVKVHPVVLPRDEVNRHLKPRHQDLAAQIAETVYMWNEHQKLIVIDDDLSFIGSMNVLAHVPGTRGRLEVMALFKSASLANRILEHERVDELVRPQTCPDCGTRVNHVKKLAHRLHWVCRAENDQGKCGWKRPFSDQPRARSQPNREKRSSSRIY